VSLAINETNYLDEKKKKNWIKITFIFLFYSLIMTAIMIMMPRVLPVPGFLGVPGSLSLVAAFELLRFALFWHFTYKNQGTKWLTVNMYYCGLFVLNSVLSIIELIYQPIVLGLFLVDLAISIKWFIASSKVRSINRRQKKVKNYPQEYLADLQNLKRAHSLSELDLSLQELTQKWPAFISFTAEEYEARKMALVDTASQEAKVPSFSA
jgi:hypothetical protein